MQSKSKNGRIGMSSSLQIKAHAKIYLMDVNDIFHMNQYDSFDGMVNYYVCPSMTGLIGVEIPLCIGCFLMVLLHF